MLLYERLHTFLCIFKKALYFPVGSASSCILGCITVRFSLYYLALCFMCFQTWRYSQCFLARCDALFNQKRGDVGNVSVLQVGPSIGVLLKDAK